MDDKRLAELLAQAKKDGRNALTEPEGVEILKALGIRVPVSLAVKSSRELSLLAPIPGDKVVIKVVSPEILHKTEAGGVAIVPNNMQVIKSAISDMESRFKAVKVDGYTINEYVSFEPRLGHEIILGYRFADDFGPLVTFGPGGIYTEFLAKTFKAGAANLFLSPHGANKDTVRSAIKGNAIRQLLCGGLRGTKAAIEEEKLVDLLMAFIEAAPVFARNGITEFEVNPFVVMNGELVALDALAKLGSVLGGDGSLSVGKDGNIVNSAQAIRPVDKIDKLLKPKSAAVIGVSDKGMNNGRIILRNLIENGFDMKRLYVVKPGSAEIDGCKCVPDVASLPEKVDLFVLVIPAAQAPACITELAEKDKAESIIVIPGGLEEKSGTEALVEKMRAALDASRRGKSRGPLINGGNCLGIRSVPGLYNTLFIPDYKLPMPKGAVAPVALISQSGAFAICRMSKNPMLNPKYTITCGNQMDVSIGDYLEHLADDPELHIFAVYVEGFKPLDGLKTLKAIKKITDSGRKVLFYRAGRTEAGAAASASHTASIAGDYPVTKALLSQAGAAVVEKLEDFDDALGLFTAFNGKTASGNRLGAISNAGFECVAFADNLGQLSIADFSPHSIKKLEETLGTAKIGEIVDAHNPLDITPMGDDELYAKCFEIIMNDPNVDIGIAGNVPLTVRMNSLPAGEGHNEDLRLPGTLPERLGKLYEKSTKPWLAVVDSGKLYDPFVLEHEKRGIPVFRTSDQALAMINLWLGRS